MAGSQYMLELELRQTSRQRSAENAMTVLSEREREVTFLVTEGLSNKQVGRRLDISEGTVKVHLYNIYRKAAVPNRAALAAMASTYGQRR